MARKVVWSTEAVTDLELLADYIARDSAAYATSLIQEILGVSKTLAEFSKKRLPIHLPHREIPHRDFRSDSC
jgi:plasmid stabilization system protein ParE